MSTQKKQAPEPNVVARGFINGDASYLRAPVDKKKVRQRGPNQVSQIPLNVPFAMQVKESEYLKRIEAATKILNEGGGSAELKAENSELKNTVKNQETQINDLLKVKEDHDKVVPKLDEALKTIEEQNETMKTLKAESENLQSVIGDLKAEKEQEQKANKDLKPVNKKAKG